MVSDKVKKTLIPIGASVIAVHKGERAVRRLAEDQLALGDGPRFVDVLQGTAYVINAGLIEGLR